jgi:hypothetical protein
VLSDPPCVAARYEALVTELATTVEGEMARSVRLAPEPMVEFVQSADAGNMILQGTWEVLEQGGVRCDNSRRCQIRQAGAGRACCA